MTGGATETPGSPWPPGSGLPRWARCAVMGVVNVTPDSFSDGGLYADADAAVRHGLELASEGADIVDVGGESTRPGATRIPIDEELHRVIPVVAALARAGVAVSVDTTREVVAREALVAGAVLVNDVSGGADEGLVRTVADARAGYVLMHSRGPAGTPARYGDVVAEVRDELLRRLDTVVAMGVDAARVVLDPGIGFSKTADHNWTLLAHLDRFTALGRPVLVGTSRKSFLGRLLAAPDGAVRAPAGRDDATTATTALAAAAGAGMVRVHDVRGSADAVRVAAAWGGQGRLSG